MDGKGSAVLIIDDETIVLKSAKRVLERKGYSVLTAENADIGIETLSAKRSDIGVILLDLTMPGTDPDETLETILNIDPTAAVLLFSGYSRNEEAERLLDQGAVGYIQKPFEIDALTEQLDIWIERHAEINTPDSEKS